MVIFMDVPPLLLVFSTDEDAYGGYGPFAPGFSLAPYGDLDAVQKLINSNVAAIMVEPIQGEGGVLIPPAGFLKGLREICDKENILLICDEIQSGLGRTGTVFAHEHAGIKADAVTIGKALSGGMYPVSAFLANDNVMDVFQPGQHGSTYGGNPIACAVANASLDVLIDENLMENSTNLGKYFGDKLIAMNSPHIKEIRQAGLWIGVELHEEAGGARKYCEALMVEGMLCKETHVNTIRFAPPLVISKEEIDWALERIQKILG